LRESDVEWTPLEDGIEIQFGTSDAPHKYRVGDYWTIPARTATADIVWPLNARACRYQCHRTARNIITDPWRGFSARTPCTFNGCSARWLNAAALDNDYITVRPPVIQQLLSQRMRCAVSLHIET
jgi:hypothetical protein